MRSLYLTLGLVCAATCLAQLFAWSQQQSPPPPDEHGNPRSEVVFWHFWGGDDERVVEEAVATFNRQQSRYFVRAVAMPGNNLDVKLFLALTGGDPPDVVNQDDPIVADWARRGALTPLAELANPDELNALDAWLFPSARQLASYRGEPWALCNGLDIRALYYNRDMLASAGLAPPQTLSELDALAVQFTTPPHSANTRTQPVRYGFLPDPRRLWVYGTVFGGQFFDETTGRVTAHDPRIVMALEWMCSYGNRFGKSETLAFRGGDQKLPGQSFPLLAQRYAIMLDGQWRVRDIESQAQTDRQAGRTSPSYGVCSIPPPENGLPDAGWVNGNFFVVPRGAKEKAGAWEFMKFWSGFQNHEVDAAKICAAGGWIPVSPHVVATSEFQTHLKQHPLLEEFVRLAASKNQRPTPSMPAAPLYVRELMNAAEQAMYGDTTLSASDLLERVSEKVQRELNIQREKEHAAR